MLKRENLAKHLKYLRRRRKDILSSPEKETVYEGYRDDPLGFAQNILKLQLTPDQQSVLEAVQKPPYRVLCSSGHSVGKTLTGAVLVLWWYYTRPVSICITTAPTDRQVKDLLWKEVRLLAFRAGLPDHFVGPKIPRLESSSDHFAHGYTARDNTRFQGHHSPGGILVIFDEAEAIDASYWQSLKTMLDDQSRFVAFYNPTEQGSATHQAEEHAESYGSYHLLNLSCLSHPNIKAGIQGKEPTILGAINLNQLREMLLEDSTLLPPGEPKLPTDVNLGHEWFRPGPIATSRCLGLRAKQSSTGLWSEELWDRLLATRIEIKPHWPVSIGCDVGRYGDDHTVIVVRKGYCITHVESHVKQSTTQIANRLRELCYTFRDAANPEKSIVCKIDEGGVGGGVIDQNEGYRFIPVNASRTPINPARYPRTRDELWFLARHAALEGVLDISRMHEMYRRRLRQELFAVHYQVLPGSDQMQVTSKKEIKAKLGRSPDLADAFCLCLYPS